MNRKTGFTLVELLVVISIIAILMSIMMPALRKSRAMAQRIGCASNLKSIVTAMTAYSSSNKGHVPYNSDIHSNMPYAWEDKTLVQPMLSYLGTMDVANCPAVAKEKTYLITDQSNFHYGEWCTKLLWLPGLGDTTHNRAGFWFENPPSVATAKRFAYSDSNKIATTDFNIVWQPYNQNWGVQSNHIYAGREHYADFGTDVKKIIKGSNRANVDISVKWVTGDEMGQYGNSIDKNPYHARYSHGGSAGRPYYW